ncbi:hypothetical protein IHE55_03925 [Streptomyces pactum]|uniref:Immunity protein 63 domain-containing protein n=1 Tax=Streptomyces pactum TaxID=68249 RepID=A0ABS0NFM2_9ACTN|nr:hypothetical protein [Streptomyces pactum]MBH5333996.1 hypothetical protein [Streptomyces pactum]
MGRVEPARLCIVAEMAEAVRALGVPDADIRERELDGGGWMTGCVIRLGGEEVECDVMHHERRDTAVRLFLDGWQFEHVDASGLRQLLVNILSGDAVIRPERGFLRGDRHVLKAVGGTTVHEAWSEAFVEERAAAWEIRLLPAAGS